MTKVYSVEDAKEKGFRVIDSCGLYFELAKGDWNNYKSEFEVVCFLNELIVNQFTTKNIAGFINDKQDF